MSIMPRENVVGTRKYLFSFSTKEDGSRWINQTFLQKTRPNFPQSEKVPAKNEEEPFCPAIRSSTHERQIVFYAIFQRSMPVRALGKPTRRSWLETNCSLGMRHVFPCELEMPSSSTMVELQSCCAHVLREKKSKEKKAKLMCKQFGVR